MTAATWVGYDVPEAEAAPVFPVLECSEAAPLRDWTEITIRPVREVHCPIHGVLGHTVRADEARAIRDAHWKTAHSGATSDDVAT